MNRVTIESKPFPHCATHVAVQDVGVDNTMALCISSGASSLQSYATRDELRELGEMLLRHANADEVLEVA